MAGNSSEAGRSVTSKITAILVTFTQGREHSLTEIARLVRLPVSTTHRLVSELASERLLERTDDGLYRAGPLLRMIGQGVVDGRPSLVERAPCVLEDLAAATRSRARLGVWHDGEVSYIEKQPGSRPATSFSPAATLPAHPTALGRSMLAFAPPGEVELTIMNGLHAFTRHTVTSPERFRRMLAVTRLTRVAISRAEFEAGTCAVAVPVFGSDRTVIAGLEVAVRELHPDLNPILTSLAIASRSLSRELHAGAATESRTGAAAQPAQLDDRLVDAST